MTKEIKESLHKWIINHPQVIKSPIANDCIKVQQPSTGKKESVPKLLLQVSVRELHNDMLKDPAEGGLMQARKNGKVVISDTAL